MSFTFSVIGGFPLRSVGKEYDESEKTERGIEGDRKQFEFEINHGFSSLKRKKFIDDDLFSSHSPNGLSKIVVVRRRTRQLINIT